MKKILIFSLAYYPHVGGAEVAIKEITDRVSDIEFHVITLNFDGRKDEEKMNNVNIHRVGSNPSYFQKILFVPRAAWRAIELNRVHPFDALWAMMSYMLFPVVIMRMVGHRTPYVLTLQEGDPFSHMFERWFIMPFLPLLRYGFKHAAVVTALSSYLAEWACRMGYRGVPKIVPNGADIGNFVNALPASIPKKNGETWLVTSSRLVHKNAVDDVIRAIALLPETVHFLVLGSGPEDGALKKLSRELGVAGRVHFEGYVPHTKLPSFLHACDIFIRPSRTEGFGASFPEAMAAGLPVVATQEGGIADFLFDKKRNPDKETTGWVVDKDSPEQIAEIIREIINSPEMVKDVVEKARKMAIGKYDWSLIAKDMKERVFYPLFSQKAGPIYS